MCVCDGNSDDDFVEMVKNKGGFIMNGEDISAYYNENSGSIHSCKCFILLRKEGRCWHCQKYRSNLRAMRSRVQSDRDARISHSSHTNNRYLDRSELEAKLRDTQTAKRTLERTVARMKKRIDALIERDGIDLVEEDEAEMSSLVDEVDEAAKASRHFLRVLWEQQKMYNGLEHKQRMRWHLLMIRFALNLKYLSSSAYKAVGNFIALPSNRTLCDYTHVITADEGISVDLIERMKKDMCFDSCDEAEKLMSIMVDGMKIKAGLVFSRRNDRIVGFVNLGSVNGDLDALESSLNDDPQPHFNPQLADNMLVIMARQLRKPSFTFPIAQYPTASVSGSQLYPMVWDVIDALEMNGLKVSSVTCDGLSANRAFFKIGRDPSVKAKVPYMTTNPYDMARKLYYFCDAPHLIKTARNCFSNSFAHCKTRNLKVINARLSPCIYFVDSISNLSSPSTSPTIKDCACTLSLQK